MTLSDAASIAQIVIAIATALGVIAAFEATRRTLREVQRDREARQAPFLSFSTGGWPLLITFSDASLSIPGLDPSAVREILKGFPNNIRRVDLKDLKGGGLRSFGRLINAGAGSALGIEVLWIAEEIKMGHDSFRIDEAKRREPLYSKSFNTMPILPQLLAPGATGQLTRLPSFIVMDIDRKISEVSGKLEITCIDVSGKKYESNQRFWLKTDYSAPEPSVHITFKDLILT